MRLFLIAAILLIACNSTQKKKKAIIEQQQRIIFWVKELKKYKIEFPATAFLFDVQIDSLAYVYDSLELELKKY
jgi:outer membrane biogenesis lipoprotein LolB